MVGAREEIDEEHDACGSGDRDALWFRCGERDARGFVPHGKPVLADVQVLAPVDVAVELARAADRYRPCLQRDLVARRGPIRDEAQVALRGELRGGVDGGGLQQGPL